MTLYIDSFQADPALLFAAAEYFSEVHGTCFLYSGGTNEVSQNSFLFLFPCEAYAIYPHGLWHCKGAKEVLQPLPANPWTALKDAFGNSITDRSSYPEWVGFFTYEMGAFAEQEKTLPHIPPSIPYAYFQRSAVIVRVDHRLHQGTLIIAEDDLSFLPMYQQEWLEAFSRLGFTKAVESRKKNLPLKPPPKKPMLLEGIESFASYEAKINKLKEYLLSGDIYQANLSHQWTIQANEPSFRLFKDLCLLNPAPFSAYLKNKDWTIVSSSPERFVKSHQGSLESCPIKGTAPRGKTVEEDLCNKQNLLSSAKERAELLMITDLVRNDLGRISLPGTVEVKSMWQCEAYANVFHLLAVIQSQAEPHCDPIDLIRALFPGGSITGCPKLRAMEILFEIEQRPRGIYTGSIGYFCGNSDFDFNIAIRTLLAQNGRIEVQLGGGILFDSDPLKEYEETLHKGQTIFKVLGYE